MRFILGTLGSLGTLGIHFSFTPQKNPAETQNGFAGFIKLPACILLTHLAVFLYRGTGHFYRKLVKIFRQFIEYDHKRDRFARFNF